MAKKTSKSGQKPSKPLREYLLPLSWPLVGLAAVVLVAIPALFTLEMQGIMRRMERLQTQGVEVEGVITESYLTRGWNSEQRIAGYFPDQSGNRVEFDIPLATPNNIVMPNSATPQLVYDPDDTGNVALLGAVLTWNGSAYQNRRTGEMLQAEFLSLAAIIGGWFAYAFRRWRVAFVQ